MSDINKKRYHFLDMLRGICIILVVFYHAMYNLSSIFGIEVWLFNSAIMDFLQVFFVMCLAVISGVSSSLTRSNAKRGIKTLAAGLVVTAVTYFAMPDQLIVFGILHFFGVSMLLYAAVEGFFEKIPMIPGAVVSFLLFVVAFLAFPINIETENLFVKYFLGILGFETGLRSADYYPIIPWVFIFLTGCFLGRPFKNGTAPKFFSLNPVRFLSFAGRHTLLVYLIHQPIIYGVMYLCLY